MASPYLMGYLAEGRPESYVTGLNRDMADRLTALYQAAPDHIRKDLDINSGFRSIQRQQQLWDAAVKKYGSAAAARKWVAPPGNSQHNHGNAVDLGYGSAAAREWAHENASRFGLHFRMGHEPWHIEPIPNWNGTLPPVDVRPMNMTPELVQLRSQVASPAPRTASISDMVRGRTPQPVLPRSVTPMPLPPDVAASRNVLSPPPAPFTGIGHADRLPVGTLNTRAIGPHPSQPLSPPSSTLNINRLGGPQSIASIGAAPGAQPRTIPPRLVQDTIASLPSSLMPSVRMNPGTPANRQLASAAYAPTQPRSVTPMPRIADAEREREAPEFDFIQQGLADLVEAGMRGGTPPAPPPAPFRQPIISTAGVTPSFGVGAPPTITRAGAVPPPARVNVPMPPGVAQAQSLPSFGGVKPPVPVTPMPALYRGPAPVMPMPPMNRGPVAPMPMPRTGLQTGGAAPYTITAPQPRPAWQHNPSVSINNGVATIAAGNTLSDIAARTGISVAQLMAANPGINPLRLQVGQQIRLSAPPPMPSLNRAMPMPLTDEVRNARGNFTADTTSSAARNRAAAGLSTVRVPDRDEDDDGHTSAAEMGATHRAQAENSRRYRAARGL